MASLAAIPLTVWLTLGGMGRRGAGRAAAALAVSALALWIQPVIKALYLGQIEPLLMLLVVWDLTRKDSRRWKGIGIGIAAGIKLVPLLFIPYLLLAGKVRQAAIATGAFLATVVVGFISLPGPSASYWLTGYFVRPGRTGSVHSLVNQSLLGQLARLYGTVAPAQPLWLPIALVVAAGGVVAGAMLARSGRPVQGWTLVGITSVLVSPISWDHHWVWVVPVLALMAGLIFQARPVVKACYAVGIVLIAGIMGSWPWKYSGPKAYVPRRGLLGWFVKPPEVTQITVVHGWQLLTWNLWVVIGLVIYLALVAAAVVTWRKRPRRKVPLVTVEKSPIDALLARADAVLRGGTLVGSGLSGQDDASSGLASRTRAGLQRALPRSGAQGRQPLAPMARSTDPGRRPARPTRERAGLRLRRPGQLADVSFAADPRWSESRGVLARERLAQRGLPDLGVLVGNGDGSGGRRAPLGQLTPVRHPVAPPEGRDDQDGRRDQQNCSHSCAEARQCDVDQVEVNHRRPPHFLLCGQCSHFHHDR